MCECRVRTRTTAAWLWPPVPQQSWCRTLLLKSFCEQKRLEDRKMKCEAEVGEVPAWLKGRRGARLNRTGSHALQRSGVKILEQCHKLKPRKKWDHFYTL